WFEEIAPHLVQRRWALGSNQMGQERREREDWRDCKRNGDEDAVGSGGWQTRRRRMAASRGVDVSLAPCMPSRATAAPKGRRRTMLGNAGPPPWGPCRVAAS